MGPAITLATYVNPEDADVPGFSVFSKRDGIIRHFYSGEMSGAMADPDKIRAEPGPRSSMADVGLDAGRPRHRLVSEARLRVQINAA